MTFQGRSGNNTWVHYNGSYQKEVSLDRGGKQTQMKIMPMWIVEKWIGKTTVFINSKWP